MDIDQAPDGYMTVNQVMVSYSSGRGIDWMYQKRIDDLARLELIGIKGGVARTTPSGKRVALRFLWLRRLLRIAE